MLQNVEQWNVYSVHQQAWNIHTWVLLHTCGRLFMEINEINKDCIMLWFRNEFVSYYQYKQMSLYEHFEMGPNNFLCIADICNQLMIKKVLYNIRKSQAKNNFQKHEIIFLPHIFCWFQLKTPLMTVIVKILLSCLHLIHWSRVPSMSKWKKTNNGEAYIPFFIQS